MKAQKTTLSVLELQKTVGQWKSRKMTCATIAKLLDLMLGMPAYMDERGVYPMTNFYDLSLALRFKNVRVLTEAVRLCGTFGVLPADNVYGMEAFYSYLWCPKGKGKAAAETRRTAGMPEESPDVLPEKLPETLPVKLPEKSPQEDIYNIYTIQDNNINNYINNNPKDNYPAPQDNNNNLPKENHAAAAGKQEKRADGTDVAAAVPSEKPAAADGMTAARHFFHLINGNPTEKAQLFTPLIDRFQQAEGLSRKDACANLVLLVNEHLVPYFDGRERFLKLSHAGRVCWLVNLLKTAHGQRMQRDAARAGQRKRQQELEAMRGRQRENRPLCEFEWTDKESGMRFYDDPIEGTVNIPADAPPRPSAGAAWDVLGKEWRSAQPASEDTGN